MVAASHLSLHLARFDALRAAGPVDPGDRPGILFCAVAADSDAAGTDPAAREAFTFLVVGLHDDRASAEGLVRDVTAVAPWFADAAERWSGVLAPFRTKGECNFIDRTAPARLFDPLVAAPERGTPVVALTTAGWNLAGLDMARPRDFGAGVAAVRISMTGVPGLRTQQSFVFPGVIAIDGLTLTFWDDEASLLSWAYRQSSHKLQMNRYRKTDNADRTSFTRLAALSSSGSWYGRDPVAATRARTSGGSDS